MPEAEVGLPSDAGVDVRRPAGRPLWVLGAEPPDHMVQGKRRIRGVDWMPAAAGEVGVEVNGDAGGGAVVH